MRNILCMLRLHKWVKGKMNKGHTRVDTCRRCGRERMAYYIGYGDEMYIDMKYPGKTERHSEERTE